MIRSYYKPTPTYQELKTRLSEDQEKLRKLLCQLNLPDLSRYDNRPSFPLLDAILLDSQLRSSLGVSDADAADIFKAGNNPWRIEDWPEWALPYARDAKADRSFEFLQDIANRVGDRILPDKARRDAEIKKTKARISRTKRQLK